MRRTSPIVEEAPPFRKRDAVGRWRLLRIISVDCLVVGLRHLGPLGWPFGRFIAVLGETGQARDNYSSAPTGLINPYCLK
jgi:hypothetical protein